MKVKATGAMLPGGGGCLLESTPDAGFCGRAAGF
jgi:hypothetical protein